MTGKLFTPLVADGKLDRCPAGRRHGMSHFPRTRASRSPSAEERHSLGLGAETVVPVKKIIVETAKQQKAGEDRVLRQIFQWIPSARLDEVSTFSPA